MNLTNAAVLAAVVFVLTDFVKRAVPVTLPAAVVQLLAFVVGIVSTFLAGATVWAHSQVIGGHALDNMNAGSKIVVGIIIGGGATVLDRLVFVGSREQDPPA